MERIFKDADETATCDDLSSTVNAWLSTQCATKSNQMKPKTESEECPCSGGAGGSPSGGVELLVLIDSSGSMRAPARIINEIAPKALETAKDSCGALPEVTYLFVDGNDGGDEPTRTFEGIFNQSHESYLIAVDGVTPPFASDGDGHLDAEQGGKAITDLCERHIWKEGYCRAVLYISDENLNSISGSDDAQSLAAADQAIAAATANNVSIFTHHIAARGPVIQSHYQKMADETGGMAVISATHGDVDEDLYVKILSEAICNGCGVSTGCATVDMPAITPCVHIAWGDSKCDGIEGDDHEEVCITICNCYGNVTLKNLRIAAIAVVDADGNFPPDLPDGSPSSRIYPAGPICFGDIGPCVDGEETCVSRNAVIINRGLPPGEWTLRVLGMCFDVAHHYDTAVQDFVFDVCKN